MADQILAQFTTGMATLNNALRQAFLPTGSRLFLLSQAADSGLKWTVIAELTSGWIVEFSEYRQQFKLLYAATDSGFADLIVKTSFIAYGVPDADSALEVFSIDPERRDIIPPTGTNAQWKVYVDKVPAKRFLVT